MTPVLKNISRVSRLAMIVLLQLSFFQVHDTVVAFLADAPVKRVNPLLVTKPAEKKSLRDNMLSEVANPKWIATVQQEIAKQEYYISFDSATGQYQSPNRAHNLRAYYKPGVYTLESRKNAAWKCELVTDGVFADECLLAVPDTNTVATIHHDSIRFSHEAYTEEYINTASGVRQNFIVYNAPDNSRSIQIKMHARGLRVNDVGNNELHFYEENNEGNIEKRITYSDLHCWDSAGNNLPARMLVIENEIILDVDVEGAAFPVTIDPLSTTNDWTTEGNQNSSRYGFSLASAGDVNGDGYSDVMVGAYLFDAAPNDEGRVFVYHGSGTGLSTSAAWTAESNQLGGNFGYAVSSAGDVNGDGYSDVIIGAHNYDNPEISEGRIYVYHGSATGLGAVSFTAESNQANSVFGSSVACAGDVNGDGYSDVIVGAYLYDNGQTDEGRAFVFHGSASGLTAPAVWTAESNQASSAFGYSVASAGDVNGDGFSDVIVGAYLFDNGQTDEGRCYVYHGSATGLSTIPAWTVESNYTPVSGVGTGHFGRSVSCAGDVNGDGYSDVIIGAYSMANGQNFEGRAFVYHGSPAGLSVSSSWIGESNQANSQFGSAVACAGDVNGDGYSDVIVSAFLYDNGNIDEGSAFVYYGSLTGLSVSYSWSAEVNQNSAQFGIAVASAGDVNGDGYSDVLVGTHLFDNGNTDEGAALVYHGSAGGLVAAANWTLESNQTSCEFGKSVASAGDINGDGFSDVLIGAHVYDNGQTDEGRVFVFYGSLNGIPVVPSLTLEINQASAQFGISVAGAGDVNGDGYMDVVVGANFYDNGHSDEGGAFLFLGSSSGLASTAAWITEGNQANAQYGTSVAGAGDVNTDGYSDVLVGAYFYDNGQTNEGRAYVYFGSAAGPALTADWTDESDQPSAQFGISVAGVGDVNGDRYGDIIIGSNLYDNGQIDEGRAFVYYGSATGPSVAPSWTTESNQTSAHYGYSVAGAGDVNGDAFNDVIVGSHAYDNGQTDEGRAFVYMGALSGLGVAAVWTTESNVATAAYGFSVASAGDVNGDGYSDVVVGAPGYANGQVGEGAAYVFHGSASGLSTSAAWATESNLTSTSYGYSVSCVGDVNGDGYNDLMVGANLLDNGNTDEGRAYLYYGNGGIAGKQHNLCLYNDDLVSVLNISNIPIASFGAGLFTKSFLGRNSAKLTWQTAYQWQPFSSAGGSIAKSTQYTAQQASYSDLGAAGTELKNLVGKVINQTKTKVRARARYSPVKAITGQVYGPWRYMAGFASGSTIHNIVPLPVELTLFTVIPNGNVADVYWSTATEINSDYFIVQRSADLVHWENAGRTEAAGNSSTPLAYSFTDEQPLTGTSYYRLQMVDLNGDVAYSENRVVYFEKQQNYAAYPNPFTNVVTVYSQSSDQYAVKLINSIGQEIPCEITRTGNYAYLNTNHIIAGVYTLIVTEGTKVTSLVLVK